MTSSLERPQQGLVLKLDCILKTSGLYWLLPADTWLPDGVSEQYARTVRKAAACASRRPIR
jgi:hypothetical protein